MRKQSIVATMILAGTLIIGTMALAQNQGPGGGGPGQGMGGNPMANMTPQQQEQMRQNMMMRMCPVQMFPALPQQTIVAITPTLQLTADQQAKADQMFNVDLTKKIAKIRNESPKVNQQLQDEMRSPNPDSARVHQLAKIAMDQEAAILTAELDAWMEFTKPLNAEQQKALWTMMSSPQGGVRGMGRMGRQGGNRQGGNRQGGNRQGGNRQGGNPQDSNPQGGNPQPNEAPPAPQDNANPGN